MYFESRAQAGYMLAEQLVERYRYENCAVVALSDGSVQVGEQIAGYLHCIVNAAGDRRYSGSRREREFWRGFAEWSFYL